VCEPDAHPSFYFFVPNTRVGASLTEVVEPSEPRLVENPPLSFEVYADPVQNGVLYSFRLEGEVVSYERALDLLESEESFRQALIQALLRARTSVCFCFFTRVTTVVRRRWWTHRTEPFSWSSLR
jgi:hypothetical protein